MGEEPEQAKPTAVESLPCPNCAATVKTEWSAGTRVTCRSCGHEFVLSDPVDYWVEGEWDEGLT